MVSGRSLGVVASTLILPLVRGDTVNVNVDVNVALTTIEPFPSVQPTPITCQGQPYVTYVPQSVCNPYQVGDCITGYKPVTSAYCSTTVSGYNGPYVISDCYQPYTYSRDVSTTTTSIVVATPGYYVAYDTTQYCPEPTTLVYAVPSAAYYVQPYLQYYQAPQEQVIEVEQCIYLSNNYRVCEIYVNYCTVETYAVPEYSLVPYVSSVYVPYPTVLNIGINIDITVDSAPTTISYTGTSTKTSYRTTTTTKTRTATSTKTASQTIFQTSTVTAQPTAAPQQFLLTINTGTKKRATSGFLAVQSDGTVKFAGQCSKGTVSIFQIEAGRLVTNGINAFFPKSSIDDLGINAFQFGSTATNRISTSFSNSNGGLVWMNTGFPGGVAKLCLSGSQIFTYYDDAKRQQNLPDCTPFTAGIQTDISCAVSGTPISPPTNGTTNGTFAIRINRRASYVYLK